jgi:hypothetical protein
MPVLSHEHSRPSTIERPSATDNICIDFDKTMMMRRRRSSLAAVIYLPLLLCLLAASRRCDVAAFSQGKKIGNHETRYSNCASSMISTTTASMKERTLLSSSLFSTDGSKKTMTTLTEDTTWRLRLLLDGVTTTKGRKLRGPTLFVLEGQFIEEEGYEPPQGYFRPITRRFDEKEQSTTTTAVAGENGGAGASEREMTLELAGSRWKLSEDPNDPKDGLWVWGLFKEPLYPFLLLQMETKDLLLEKDGDGGDSLPALKLYAQVSHVRSEKTEGDVVLSTANLNVRVLEQVKLPGATVDLYEEEAVGRISFQPLP